MIEILMYAWLLPLLKMLGAGMSAGGGAAAAGGAAAGAGGTAAGMGGLMKLLGSSAAEGGTAAGGGVKAAKAGASASGGGGAGGMMSGKGIGAKFKAAGDSYRKIRSWKGRAQGEGEGEGEEDSETDSDKLAALLKSLMSQQGPATPSQQPNTQMMPTGIPWF